MQIFRKPLDNGGPDSIMLINMFEMTFKDFFKSNEIVFASSLWSTMVRLLQTWGVGPAERFESWEYYKEWIAIAQSVFEKGTPKAQVCMLQAWRDYIFVSAEYPLTLKSSKVSDVNQVKSIVTLTRPLKLLCSPHEPVVEQAEECCTHIIYSCMNPLFVTSFNNSVELDVFWTDVVETSARLLVKEGPLEQRRKLYLLSLLTEFFNNKTTSHSPTTSLASSPTKSRHRWMAHRLLEEHINIYDLPGLPPTWVRSKSHFIINTLLNTVLPNMTTEPWIGVWRNFVTLSCQQMYREQKSSARLSEDSYNVLRTVMNGTVQILNQYPSLGSQIIHDLLTFLVDICEPILPQLLHENMIFSVSIDGPYIMRCASSAASLAETEIPDTFNLNPVILLWTIIMKFSQGLNAPFISLSGCAYMKLLKLLLPSATKQLAADVTTVLTTMVYDKEFPIEPLWKYIYDATELQSVKDSYTEPEERLISNMIRLHIFISSPAYTKNSSIHDWSHCLSIYAKLYHAHGKMANFPKDAISIVCSDLLSSSNKVGSHSIVLFYFLRNLLRVTPVRDILRKSMADDSDSWKPFLSMTCCLFKFFKSDLAQMSALAGFFAEYHSAVKTLESIPEDIIQDFFQLSVSDLATASTAQLTLDNFVCNLQVFKATKSKGKKLSVTWSTFEVLFLKECLKLPEDCSTRKNTVSKLADFVSSHGLESISPELELSQIPGFPIEKARKSGKKTKKASLKKKKAATSVTPPASQPKLKSIDDVQVFDDVIELAVHQVAQNSVNESTEIKMESDALNEKASIDVSEHIISSVETVKSEPNDATLETSDSLSLKSVAKTGNSVPDEASTGAEAGNHLADTSPKDDDTHMEDVSHGDDMLEDHEAMLVDEITNTQVIDEVPTPTKTTFIDNAEPTDMSMVSLEEPKIALNDDEMLDKLIPSTAESRIQEFQHSASRDTKSVLSDSPAIARTPTPEAENKTPPIDVTESDVEVAQRAASEAVASTPDRHDSPASKSASAPASSSRVLRSHRKSQVENEEASVSKSRKKGRKRKSAVPLGTDEVVSTSTKAEKARSLPTFSETKRKSASSGASLIQSFPVKSLPMTRSSAKRLLLQQAVVIDEDEEVVVPGNEEDSACKRQENERALDEPENSAKSDDAIPVEDEDNEKFYDSREPSCEEFESQVENKSEEKVDLVENSGVEASGSRDKISNTENEGALPEQSETNELEPAVQEHLSSKRKHIAEEGPVREEEDSITKPVFKRSRTDSKDEIQPAEPTLKEVPTTEPVSDLESLEQNTSKLLAALEMYSKSATQENKTPVTDKSKIFELETKLMQALMQTRTLAMES